jgi:hypothetical protein
LIRGFFAAEEQLPRVTVRIELESIPGAGNLTAQVDFVVDTASTDSCLHPGDARAIEALPRAVLMDPSRWPIHREHAGVGGSGTYFLAPCTYVFAHENGALQSIEGTIDIAYPTLANLGVPSVLGWDVLQHFAIHLDWSQRLVELA